MTFTRWKFCSRSSNPEPVAKTGIKSVELIYGEAFEDASKSGRWSTDLVEAAVKAETDMNAVRQGRPTQGVFFKV